MTLAPTSHTMLGLAADQQRSESARRHRDVTRSRVRLFARRIVAALALVIGLSSFSMGTAQAWIFDDLKENIASTIVNICNPNDVDTPTTYQNIDTLAGLNKNPSEGARATVLPSYPKGGGAADDGASGLQRLKAVYGDDASTIRPTYERYGFSPLRWTQYGNSCSPDTVMMGPSANAALFGMVHVPMMLSMAVLNFVMTTSIYTAFAHMIGFFTGAMYAVFAPWIYFVAGIGVIVAWLASKGSAMATMKAAAWALLMIVTFVWMGNSTSTFVTFSSNIVTEVSGAAACHMGEAAEKTNPFQGDNYSPPSIPKDGKTHTPADAQEDSCGTDDPVKAVNEALWYGIPYQTWLVGQVGESRAAASQKHSGVTWGSALLNGNYVGTTVDDNGNATLDKDGRKLLQNVEDWNGAPYTDGGKVKKWGKDDAWSEIPALTNVKMMCNDQDKLGDDPGEDPSPEQRWMFSGAAGEGGDEGSYYCDAAGAGTTQMISTIRGDEYNKQFLLALTGLVGVAAVGLTVGGAAIYLGYKKMSFFMLLFLGPVVLTISALADARRRPFAIRYAEMLGANILHQIAAVCIVLFTSYAMASLFGGDILSAVPWIMKPFAAALFFFALVLMAFPLKTMMKGAVRGDTSAVDKTAQMPKNAAKTAGKAALIGGGVVAAGAAAPALVAAGGKAATVGKAGTMLGQAGRVMGIGSKTGRAMRAGGMLMQASHGIMESRSAHEGRQTALRAAADSLMTGPDRERYVDPATGQLRPGAQKMAMKDAAKMTEAGRAADKASQAQDVHMAQIFSGWKSMYGQHHPDDPQSPENLRVAQMQRERDRRDAKAGVDAEGAASGVVQGGSLPRTGDGELRYEQSTPVGPLDGAGDYDSARDRYRKRAMANLGGPAFSREMDYETEIVATGEDELLRHGLTKRDVLQDPTKLLRGEAYEGGSTTAMDPFHPATAAMNQLRFAATSEDEDAMEAAVAQSADAIEKHGVPDHIKSVVSKGQRAEEFEGIEVLGAMPTITEDTSWGERAEAAHTMMAAQVAMPADFGARDEVQAYTAALANPSVDPASLDALKTEAMDAINVAVADRNGSGDLALAGVGGMAAGAGMAGDGPSQGWLPPGYEGPTYPEALGGVGPSQGWLPPGYEGPTLPPQDYGQPAPTVVTGQSQGTLPPGYEGPSLPPQDYGQPAPTVVPGPSQGWLPPGYEGPTYPEGVAVVGPSQGAVPPGYEGPASPGDSEQPSESRGDGVTRDDIKSAVAEGMREAQHEAQQSHGVYDAPAPTESDAISSPPPSAVGGSPVTDPTPTVFRDTRPADDEPPSPSGTPVESAQSDEPIIYRPPERHRRRKNDPDEEEDDADALE